MVKDFVDDKNDKTTEGGDWGFSKITKGFTDNLTASECKNSGDELADNIEEFDWAAIPDSEFSKLTQPGRGKNVIKGADKNVVVTKLEKNVVEDSLEWDKGVVVLDDTPVVARRPRKPAKACESPYVTNFESSGSSVQGPVAPLTKRIFSTKHPFETSVNLLLISINFVNRSIRVKEKLVYSEKVNKLKKIFDFGVASIGEREWFFILAYLGQPLSDSGLWYICCCFC
ncbi:uncharacterized protein LOC132063987 isoform X3 [Lycium ferocissimum]|uniref:uncharacterized protein LOC132063987 isoform X3 n=2 Tax=Lycium ferocissimum TaxID=112874 RepID=UPI00281653A7|nr:uncharacterized protein LOC132063987 isoform X3 [Lycium ferocissimum]